MTPRRLWRTALDMVRSAGTLVVCGPAVWELHDFPRDYWRPLPDFYREFANRQGLVLAEDGMAWVLTVWPYVPKRPPISWRDDGAPGTHGVLARPERPRGGLDRRRRSGWALRRMSDAGLLGHRLDGVAKVVNLDGLVNDDEFAESRPMRRHSSTGSVRPRSSTSSGVSTTVDSRSSVPAVGCSGTRRSSCLSMSRIRPRPRAGGGVRACASLTTGHAWSHRPGRMGGC